MESLFKTLMLFFFGFGISTSFIRYADAVEPCKTTIVKEKTPEVFKKSDVTRVLNDGTVQKFDGNKYKIVPRTQKRRFCKTCGPKPVVVERVVKETVIKRKRNNLQLFLGNGPSDSLRVTNTGQNTARVTSGDENLIGIGYSREILDIDEDLSLSVGAQYLTNETLTLSVGLNW